MSRTESTYHFTDPSGVSQSVEGKTFLRSRGATYMGLVRRNIPNNTKWTAVSAEMSEERAKDVVWYAIRKGIQGLDFGDEIAAVPITEMKKNVPSPKRRAVSGTHFFTAMKIVALTDPDRAGVYEITVRLGNGTHRYRTEKGSPFVGKLPVGDFPNGQSIAIEFSERGTFRKVKINR